MAGEMIYATHRELNGWRSTPALDDRGQVKPPAEQRASRPRWSEPIDCAGRLIIDPDTQLDEVWIATCDQCAFEIGIPDRAQKAFWARESG